MIGSLADKHLLRQGEGPNGELRLGMLETIREFAAERLAESGESGATRRAHAQVYLALVVDAEPGDLFLLCSDGLTNMLDDGVLRRMLSAHEPLDVTARGLVDAANAQGGVDNITVLLLRAEAE